MHHASYKTSGRNPSQRLHRPLQDGARSLDPEKHYKDLHILQEALRKEPWNAHYYNTHKQPTLPDFCKPNIKKQLQKAKQKQEELSLEEKDFLL